MRFLYPYVLFLLLVPLLLAVVALVAHNRAGKSWQLLVAPSHRAALVRRRPLWRTALPAALGLLGLSFALLAAARPINGYKETEAVANGRNLIIAIDVSRSMETTDVAPSRLEEARSAAYELIDALPTDKIGLMVFAGEADLVVPLTYDHTALKKTLSNINREWVATGGTNFGRVLQRAMQDFERSAPDGTNALVILSDGEDTMETSEKLAEEAREKKLLVISVGIGTAAGGAIPDARGQNGLWQDAEGKHVISKLDTARLSRFAQATGGDFFTMSSGTDLAAFARQAAEKLDRHEEKFSAAKVPNDLYRWFALPALLLVVAAILLGTEWRRAARPGTVALLFLLLWHCPPADAATREGVQAYAKGVSHKAAGKKTEAGKEFAQAVLDEDPALQAAAYHALGNTSAESAFEELRALYASPSQAPTPEALQKIADALKNALVPYNDALKSAPTFAPARKNIDAINTFIKKLEEEIERLKQQQQQDNQQQQQDNQQQQQDNQQQQQDDQQQQQDDQQQQQDNQQQQQDDRQQQQDNQQQQQDNQQDNRQQQQDDRQDDRQDNQQDNRQQQQDDRQKQGDNKPQPTPTQPQQDPSEKEKAKQRAASILKMHLDEETGSPIPQQYPAVPPAKDY